MGDRVMLLVSVVLHRVMGTQENSHKAVGGHFCGTRNEGLGPRPGHRREERKMRGHRGCWRRKLRAHAQEELTDGVSGSGEDFRKSQAAPDLAEAQAGRTEGRPWFWG